MYLGALTASNMMQNGDEMTSFGGAELVDRWFTACGGRQTLRHRRKERGYRILLHPQCRVVENVISMESRHTLVAGSNMGRMHSIVRCRLSPCSTLVVRVVSPSFDCQHTIRSVGWFGSNVAVIAMVRLASIMAPSPSHRNVVEIKVDRSS